MGILDDIQDFAASPFGIFALGPQNALGLATTPQPVLVAGAVALGAAIGGPILAGAASFGLTRLLREDPQFPQAQGVSQQNIRDAAAPWRYIYGQARVGGVYTFLEASVAGRYVHGILTVAAHECEELGTVYLDGEAATFDADDLIVTPARYAGKIKLQKSLGDEADGVQPFPDLEAASDDLWTSAHNQTGHAKIYLRFQMAGALAEGMPVITCLVKGRKVLDPRYSPAERVYSANAALCQADYMQLEHGMAVVYATEIDEVQLIAAANLCDEQVALASGSPIEYERRYQVHGTLAADQAPREALTRFNTAHAGHTRFIAGRWSIAPGVYPTPEATALTVDDLRGQIRILPRLPKRDLCNGVKGLFASPDNDWQPTDFPPVVNSTYLAEDQGERLWREMNLRFTKSAAAAQRIAKIELERVRQQTTLEWAGKLTCYRLQPGDVVPVTFSKYGYSAKAFMVMSATLILSEDGTLGVDLVLRETAAAVYDWSAEETTVDAAPDTNLPDSLGPSDVTGFVATQNAALVVFGCDQVTDSDLDNIEIRKCALGVLDNMTLEEAWAIATSLTRILRGNTSTSAAVEPGDWTFLAKAQDRAGNYSTAAVSYDLTVTNAGYTTIEEVEQAQAWTQLHEGESCVDLGGAGQYVAVSGFDHDFDTGDFSLRIKANPDSFAATRPMFAFQSGTGSPNLFLLLDTAGELSLQMITTASHVFSAGGAVWTAGTEQDIVVTVDRDGLATFYKDGLPIGTVNVSAASGSLAGSAGFPLNIGRRFHPVSSTQFLGTLRDAAVYNRVISADEVAALAAGEDVNSGLVGRWRMDEGTGVTAADSSGEGHDGSLTGGATWGDIETTPTFHVHHTGVLVVASTKAPSEMTRAELFEQYVPYPVPVATVPTAEIDKTIDGDARIRAEFTTRAAGGRTDGEIKPQLQVDYKLAAGEYDGFENWAAGQADFRYCKARGVLDTSLGVPVIEGFNLIVDAPTRSEVIEGLAVASGGTAFTFDNPFHATPSIQITPVGTTALIGTVESPSGTGGTAHTYNTAGAGAAGLVNVSAQGA